MITCKKFIWLSVPLGVSVFMEIIIHWAWLGASTFHDDVIKWKHFPLYWPFVRGIHRSLVNSPHKSQWRGALMFSLICAWINGWVNKREAGDLRRHRAHYDVNLIHINIGSASGSRDFTRFGPGGSTLSRFPCKTPIGNVGISQYTVVKRKLA